MEKLSEFKNYLVFDQVYKSPAVNTLHKVLEEYSKKDDAELCKYCFYGNNSKAHIIDDFSSSKRKTKRKKSNRNKKTMHPPKKNITFKK